MDRSKSSSAATVAAVLLALFLAGCTAAQRVAVTQGVEQARQTKDAEAELLAAGLCAMGVGAKNRKFNESEQCAIESLCGGECQRPVTADDLRSLFNLGEMFGGS